MSSAFGLTAFGLSGWVVSVSHTSILFSVIGQSVASDFSASALVVGLVPCPSYWGLLDVLVGLVFL